MNTKIILTLTGFARRCRWQRLQFSGSDARMKMLSAKWVFCFLGGDQPIGDWTRRTQPCINPECTAAAYGLLMARVATDATCFDHSRQ